MWEIEIRSFKLPLRFIWAMIYSYLIYLACRAQFINQVTWTKQAHTHRHHHQLLKQKTENSSIECAHRASSTERCEKHRDIIATISYKINVFLGNTSCSRAAPSRSIHNGNKQSRSYLIYAHTHLMYCFLLLLLEPHVSVLTEPLLVCSLPPSILCQRDCTAQGNSVWKCW